MSAAVWPVLGGLVGLVIGSFVAVLVRRWPEGRGVGGRSACDGCGETLRWWELLPVISHVALRGRCARCDGRIGRNHLWTELAGGAIGLATLAVRPEQIGFSGALFGWTLLALALLDVRHFWLPDRLTLPLILAGLALGPAGLPDRAIGFAVGAGSLWLVATAYRRRRDRIGLGLGDVKLFGALGAWLGWRPLPWVLLGACLIGLGWILALRLAGRPIGRTTRLPFGTMLAAAGFAGWLYLATG